MEVIYPLLIDFLDTPETERSPGIYIFLDEHKQYLKDIPKEWYSYEIRREPSSGKFGLVDIFSNYADLIEVFSTNRATSSTYVNRSLDENTTFESTLELFMREPGGIVVMYGPSKLGKTVLWKSVIKESKCLVLSCSNERTVNNIYQQILYELKQPFISELTEEITDINEKKKSAEVILGSDRIIGGKIGSESLKGKTEGHQEKHQFPERQNNIDTVTKELSNKNKTIIFENYHRLSNETLQKLCIDLRTLSDNQINTLFVGIPKDPYEMISHNKELEGRVSFIQFTHWNLKDLQGIAKGGQEVLRAYFKEDCMDFLSQESAGSPLLMQLYCFIACLASGVVETQEEDAEINITSKEFLLAMKRWGIQRLRHCERVCEIIQNEAKKISGLPMDFLDLLFNEIKKLKPQLSINFNQFNFSSGNKSAVDDLIFNIDKHQITSDLFSFDKKTGEMKINRPTFISYIRWIHNK